eukprot:NODE_6021_length_887_cov_63.941099_g5792_i0.p1 GENE.NODE_6021_length_887_cov_63.941099_g5792_i0~~NODE_6021_length_887_cov_63.941099_g5792_i0.p1  ORF type:complete len:235 (-),score=41.68 NODE_6021_length_887_cov_63.941099_g5792_i0:100-804(-)
MPVLWQSMLLSGLLMCSGDLNAQVVEKKFRSRKAVDAAAKRSDDEDSEDTEAGCRSSPPPETSNALALPRTLRLTALGTFWTAPNACLWYVLMHRLLPGQSLGHAVLKTVISQSTFAFWMNGSFLYLEAALRTGSLEEAKSKVRNDLWGLMQVNWAIWPVANLLNFGFIQPGFQSMFDSFFNFFWSVILAYRCALYVPPVVIKCPHRAASVECRSPSPSAEPDKVATAPSAGAA